METNETLMERVTNGQKPCSFNAAEASLEAQLMERVTHGDGEAFAELLKRHEEDVRRLVGNTITTVREKPWHIMIEDEEYRRICAECCEDVWTSVRTNHTEYAGFLTTNPQSPFMAFLMYVTMGVSMQTVRALLRRKYKTVI